MSEPKHLSQLPWIIEILIKDLFWGIISLKLNSIKTTLIHIRICLKKLAQKKEDKTLIIIGFLTWNSFCCFWFWTNRYIYVLVAKRANCFHFWNMHQAQWAHKYYKHYPNCKFMISLRSWLKTKSFYSNTWIFGYMDSVIYKVNKNIQYMQTFYLFV